MAAMAMARRRRGRKAMTSAGREVMATTVAAGVAAMVAAVTVAAAAAVQGPRIGGEGVRRRWSALAKVAAEPVGGGVEYHEYVVAGGRYVERDGVHRARPDEGAGGQRDRRSAACARGGG
eukprot:6167878-Pleurochrysis_carterae.AAC.1